MKIQLILYCLLFFSLFILNCNRGVQDSYENKFIQKIISRHNKDIAGVYDSTAIIIGKGENIGSSPLMLFETVDLNYQKNIFFVRSFVPILFRAYETKKLHQLLTHKNKIKIIAILPINSVETNYEISIKINSDTFHYPYIADKTFSNINGMLFDIQFFIDAYKNEPDVCKYIAKEMVREQFYSIPHLRPSFYKWLENMIIHNNNKYALSLLCEYSTSFLHEGAMGIDLFSKKIK